MRRVTPPPSAARADERQGEGGAPARSLVVVLGHPRGAASLSGGIAEAYAAGARAAGWRVELFDLSRLRFEVNLDRPSPCQQSLEPDLQRVRRAIERADHLAFVYPTWWGTMPALLKGFLDRVLAPGWAFAETTGGPGFKGLLGGRTAEILTTMDTPDFVYRWIYGAPGHRAMARATLGFCGIDVVRVTRFGAVRDSEAETRSKWIAEARATGLRLAHGPRTRLQRLWTTLRPWLVALRLQFYPMTFIAYALGAVAAPAVFDPSAFWLGVIVLFLLEAATVFTNDVVDQQTDRRNLHWGPFTGGSRVLVDGALSPRSLSLAAAVLVLAAAAAAALVLSTIPAPLPLAAALGILAVLALGYTLPPLKLCYRGLGELDVALTHSFGVVYVGWLAQGGDPGDPAPLLLSAPLFLAVLPAITLSGIPDRDADRAAGKRSLAVATGVDGALAIAAAAAAAAAIAAIWCRHGAGLAALAGLDLVAPVHAGLLIVLIAGEARRQPASRRIDRLMLAGLGYVLWFGVIPLFNLLA